VSELAGVLLARHGQTRDNLPPGRFQGWTDTPLNETGRREAFALGGRIAALERPIASLWSSDLGRAAETASIVGAAIGLRPILDWRMREGFRGRWEGYLFEEIRASEPEHFAAWLRGGADFRFPGGESLAEHQARVRAALIDIHARGPLPALVVCHGGSIRAMLAERDPRGLDAFHDFEVPNVAVERL
jgi:broad specificity phosphatase PhoE